MEVTDRLGGVTQVTFQYDISSYCHSHCTLIFSQCRTHVGPASRSFFLPLLSLHRVLEQSIHSLMWFRQTVGGKKKVTEIIFVLRGEGQVDIMRRRIFLHNYGGGLTSQISIAEG